jgi:hypothetical protein
MNDDDNNLPAVVGGDGISRTERGTWVKGTRTPNESGRGKGHLNKFSRAFLQSVSAKWREHGDAVLEEIRRDDPGLFLRVCASLIPKELLVVTHSTTPLQQLTSMELQTIIFNEAQTAEKMRARLEPLIEELAKENLGLARKMWAAMKADDDVED